LRDAFRRAPLHGEAPASMDRPYRLEKSKAVFRRESEQFLGPQHRRLRRVFYTVQSSTKREGQQEGMCESPCLGDRRFPPGARLIEIAANGPAKCTSVTTS
jgi:hypothetical protein